MLSLNFRLTQSYLHWAPNHDGEDHLSLFSCMKTTPLIVLPVHAFQDSMLTDGPEVNPEEVWPTGSTGERAIPGAEEEMMKQEMEPFCEQELQAAEAVSDGETQEMEPLSEGVAPASEAQKDRKEQQAELMCEGLFPAAEEMMNNGAQQEPEHHDQAESLFDLLDDDDDDVEGVELGEEELGEDDYI